MSEADALFASWVKTLERAQNVACPACHRTQDLSEEHDLVTYHGESGPHAFTCQFCFEIFWVTEKVLRTYEVSETPA